MLWATWLATISVPPDIQTNALEASAAKRPAPIFTLVRDEYIAHRGCRTVSAELSIASVRRDCEHFVRFLQKGCDFSEGCFWM